MDGREKELCFHALEKLDSDFQKNAIPTCTRPILGMTYSYSSAYFFTNQLSRSSRKCFVQNPRMIFTRKDVGRRRWCRSNIGFSCEREPISLSKTVKKTRYFLQISGRCQKQANSDFATRLIFCCTFAKKFNRQCRAWVRSKHGTVDDSKV